MALLPCVNLTATVFNITPSDDIQTVINGAVTGDTIVLESGRYNITNEVHITKGITLAGTDGYTNTIIDADYSTRCFFINHTQAVVDGLTITHGSATNMSGAGIFCDAGTIQNCLITSNSVLYAGDNYYGGGVYCGSDGMISNCVLSGKAAAFAVTAPAQH